MSDREDQGISGSQEKVEGPSQMYISIESFFQLAVLLPCVTFPSLRRLRATTQLYAPSTTSYRVHFKLSCLEPYSYFSLLWRLSRAAEERSRSVRVVVPQNSRTRETHRARGGVTRSRRAAAAQSRRDFSRGCACAS